jgi:hypothetical protein
MEWVIGIGIFAVLLFAFPRQMGILFLILAVIGLGIWGYLSAQSRSRALDLANLEMTASHGNPRCDAEFPILVSMTNATGKRINSISFRLEAFRPGYSANVYSEYPRSDRIIEPSTGYSSCWSINRYSLRTDDDVSTLNWTASPTSIRFAQ